MALIAMAIPIPATKKDHWQHFVGELQGAKRGEFAASRRQLGVRERTFHQETPAGDFVIVTLEGSNPESAFARFGQDSSPFAQWFKDQVKEIHGLDFSQPPPGPMPKLIVDSGE